MRTIILITKRFPYPPGEEFLETELPYLSSAFDRVLVVPCELSRIPRRMPSRVEIETGLASALSTYSRQTRLRCIARHSFLFGKAVMLGAAKPPAVRRAISAAYSVATCQEWFSRYMSHHVEKTEKLLFFCWWTTLPILGARLASRGRVNVAGIVSRAQRYDLYTKEEEDGGPNWPFHERVLKSLDRVFVASDHGARYLASRYPWMTAKTEVGRLGTEDFGVKDLPGTPTPFVVCSCAYLNQIKRVDLLIRSLEHVGTELPAVSIQWHHFGDGPLRSELENLAIACLPKNIVATFHGLVDNAQVRSFYRNNFIHIFVNTSSSEGVPVSIMEAQCAGIPVIATAVGGTPELVNNTNGLLLPASFGAADLAAGISHAILEPTSWLEKRRASRQTWQVMSDASKNYREFAGRLNQFFEYAHLG